MTSNNKLILGSEVVKNYYETVSLDLSVITHINFRHFRLHLADGRFYKIPRKIRTWKELQAHLLCKLPLDVYYSSSCWLNPQRLGSRTGNELLEQIMISADLVFDIDNNGEEIRSFEEARKQTASIISFLKQKKIEIRYVAFSGSKGFHIVCNDPWGEAEKFEDATQREREATCKRKELIEEAKGAGLFFDEKVTEDTRRIIRLPGTINSKTGLPCTRLTETQINWEFDKIYKLVASRGVITPLILCSPEKMTRAALESAAKSLGGNVGRLGVRPAPQSQFYFSTFISNNVPKTTLKIPVLEFGKWNSVKKVELSIADIQVKYGIGDVFLFDSENKYVAMSLKALSRRRLEKILFNAGSVNLNSLQKYGCTYMRLGKDIGADGAIIHKAPIFIKTMFSDCSGQISRPHCEFLVSMGIPVRVTECRLCGSSQDELEMIYGIME